MLAILYLIESGISCPSQISRSCYPALVNRPPSARTYIQLASHPKFTPGVWIPHLRQMKSLNCQQGDGLFIAYWLWANIRIRCSSQKKSAGYGFIGLWPLPPKGPYMAVVHSAYLLVGEDCLFEEVDFWSCDGRQGVETSVWDGFMDNLKMVIELEEGGGDCGLSKESLSGRSHLQEWRNFL